MVTWVALLRGVNVNGITIRSAELKTLFVELGFGEVATVLASGNVRFETDAAPAALKARIEAALRERFGYDAWIVLVGLDRLREVVDAFPFDDTDAARHPYVVFCADDAVRDELADAAASLEDEDPVQAGPGVLYWSVEKGHSVDTPFAKLLAKARYKPSTTTRNLRTLDKLLA